MENLLTLNKDTLPQLDGFQRFSGLIMSFKQIIKERNLNNLIQTFSSDPQVFNEIDPETDAPPISISRFVYTGVLGPQLNSNV